MAITRRQSGKLPTPTRKSLEPRSELDSDDAEILSSESDLTELDDEDDEYLEGNARTSPSTTRRHIENDLSDHEAPQPLRQSKKQKTSKSVVGAAKSNGRRARLAVLPTMPLDILFEILGHLRPVDLLQVARASKVLRKILMSRSSKSVWNAARENVPGLPATPGDISDAQWAHLIFETDCHAPGCKKKGIRKIDWALRIRACERCLKENVVWSRRFAKRFPDLQPDIMQLLPHSNIGGWAHGHSSDSLFYWEPAIWDMSKELGEYQKNAQEALAGEIVKYASVCQAWASSAVNQRQEELRDLSDKRVKEIKARFEVLGWSPSHLARLEWDPVACESKKLTERGMFIVVVNSIEGYCCVLPSVG
ncbi:hypothetical protein BD410DRAFT_783186 [Rickenella mellea]|uniref:F-box domain-containing protein n=1 Tax=Rickenella mellea TaxID=50990 RepID=A0A4Y7QHA6_9AGAM|nr:hypothetical protein BD410DRAFT_783186 [Rickenella mellea]